MTHPNCGLVRGQPWKGRRQGTGPTPGKAQAPHSIRATTYVLAWFCVGCCWWYGVNGHMVVCVPAQGTSLTTRLPKCWPLISRSSTYQRWIYAVRFGVVIARTLVSAWRFVGNVAQMMTIWLRLVMPGNSIGEEGAKTLGPHLAKLNNMTTLNLNSACMRVMVFERIGLVFVCAAWGEGWPLGDAPDNNLREAGAKALGPHLATLVGMTTLKLRGACWRVPESARDTVVAVWHERRPRGCALDTRQPNWRGRC